MNPLNVNPEKFTEIRVIYTSPDKSFSIATGHWKDDEMERFAMRWNGDINNPNEKGFPLSHNNPMWFQLPYDLRDLISVLIINSRPMTINP